MVQYHILSESILEIDDINQYQVDFGTFNISQEGVLVQTFRMGEDYKELSFIMNLKTQKIISVSLWDDQYQALSKKDIQTMTWGMIQYLELNDIVSDILSCDNKLLDKYIKDNLTKKENIEII